MNVKIINKVVVEWAPYIADKKGIPTQYAETDW